jgi:hypothetical protein
MPKSSIRNPQPEFRNRAPTHAGIAKLSPTGKV